METSPELNELAAALAKAQGAIKAAIKDSTNPHFKSKYADLAGVMEAAREPLSSNGLSVTQWPGECGGNQMEMTTMLMHSSGQWMRERLTIPLSKVDAQGYGSATTYARRYALAAAVGIVQDDDDGNAASNPKGVSNDAPAEKFPEGPASGITQMKAMARALWREIEGCGDDSELNGLLGVDANKALMKQMAALENPQHREIWEGDGKDNPGLAGLITRKETEFAQRIVDITHT